MASAVRLLALFALTAVLAGPALAEAQPTERLLDDFSDPANWTLVTSDDVRASLRQAPAGGPDAASASVSGRTAAAASARVSGSPVAASVATAAISGSAASASGAGGAGGASEPPVGPAGKAPGLCIDFDFGRVTGYVAARRRLPIDWPVRYELRLSAGGAVAGNDLQVKFVDASGANVWWAQRPAFRAVQGAPASPLRWRPRQLEFAWGPTADRRLAHTEDVELVVVSAGGARAGSACFDRFSLAELPPVPEVPPVPTAQAGSALDRHPAAAAIDADPASDWQPAASAGDAAVLTIDYGRPRELSLLTLRWRDGAAARRYRIALSDDGEHWRDSRSVDRARGSLQRHCLIDAEARYLQIAVDESEPRKKVALAEVELGEAATADACFNRLAQDTPRGRYPRAYSGEQPYWTVFGVDGGPVASLIGEDGAVEPVPGVGAVEPYLLVDGRVVGWADVASRHTLRRGDLPMPAVHWRAGPQQLALDIEAFAIPAPAVAAAPAVLGEPTAPAVATAAAAPGASKSPELPDLPAAPGPSATTGSPVAVQAMVRYRLTNHSTRPQAVTLVLAWRPFQVNPPTQFLAHPGGASRIERLAWTGQALQVDGIDRLQPLTRPGSVRIEPLAAGPVAEWLGATAGPAEPSASELQSRPGASAKLAGAGAGEAAAPAEVVDPAGFPSAALRFPLRLRPGERREVLIALPVAGAPAVPTAASVTAAERRVVAGWRERLDRVRLTGPAEVDRIATTLRATLGQVLVNRSGPALQPGARAYARSWIRDGALTSSALLRLGQEDVARDFLLWFAPFQFASGKIPCCATARGADPVPENDSDGEFLYAAGELWRYSRDRPTAERLWPHARAAAAHLEGLRQSERRAENLAPERRAYYGLMPPSISHEGYSDRPAYSYWDDFWAATGYRSAAALAQALGHTDDARRLAAEQGEFVADLLASLTASSRLHRLDLLPGAADRGDVDPTSSSIALSPGDLLATLPQALVRKTFDRYWRDLMARRDSGRPWEVYTPYEWRNVGAFVRLGERERALQAVAWFRRDRRPTGWQQWAEVVGREARTPRFVGDMPHGWVASDQIRSVLDLVAFEDAAADRLVLAAGVPMAWFGGRGLTLTGLRTPWGRLGWSGRAVVADRGRAIDIQVQRLRQLPAGGIELRGPWPAASKVRIDGQPSREPADRIRLTKTPARIRILLPDT